MQLLIKTLILTLLSSVAIQAQTYEVWIVEGFVVNARTAEPIPFANIGILDTQIGTLSNEDGSFSVKVPSKYKNTRLIFSSLGYEKKSIPLNTLDTSSPMLISLSERITQLDEVVVSRAKFEKRKALLGNGKSLLIQGNLILDSLYAGGAYALLIDKNEYPDLDYLHKASLHIAKNLMPMFRVRMRILAVDSLNDQKPGHDLIMEEVIEASTMKKGWLDFSLKNLTQIEQDAFYLTFEWILNKEERDFIHVAYEAYMNEYPDRVSHDTTIIDGEEIVSSQIGRVVTGTIFGATSTQKDRDNFVCYSRANSFGKWERSSSILSAKITMANYPQDEPIGSASIQDSSLSGLIDQWATLFKEEKQIPGLQLAIMKDDSLLYSNALGYSDAEKKINVNPMTQFRIASVSKTMTSAGIMNLVSQDKIDLDGSVRQYVASFPLKDHTLTIRQLLGHLGGIRDYYELSLEDELFIQKHYKSSTEAISIFSNDPLVAEPGTQFVYSSFGYNLLGAVIESVTNQHYLEYMKQVIWEPLKMDFTYGDIADSVMIHKSKFYYFSGDEAAAYDLSYFYPSGGLLSTSEDLVNFGSALLAGRLLDANQFHQVFETQYTLNRESTGYGLGWYIGKDFDETKAWYHAGELPSSGSMLLIYPEHKVVIALLANTPIISETDDGFSDEIQNLGAMIYKF